MLTPRKQAGLTEGARIKYKGHIIRVDYAGIDSDQRPYIEVYMVDGPYRIYRDDPQLSELMSRSAEQLKIWLTRLDQVTNR